MSPYYLVTELGDDTDLNKDYWTEPQFNKVLDLFYNGYLSLNRSLEAAVDSYMQHFFPELCQEGDCDWWAVIASMFARVGAEAGKTKILMQDNDIMWGTFTDHSYAIHGNAHSNNFVALDPTTNAGNNLIAALDFDTSYDFGMYVNTRDDWFKKPLINIKAVTKYCTQDREQFNRYMMQEKHDLE